MDLFDEFHSQSSSSNSPSHPVYGGQTLLQVANGKPGLSDADAMFALDKVQFSFPGAIVSMVVANNMMVVALVSPATTGQYLFWIDLGQTQSIEEFEIPLRVKSDIVRKLFIDPMARHLIISTELGDNYYLYRGWKKPKNLAKFKGVIVESIAWGNPARNQPDSNTGLILIGSRQGHIFEAELQATDEYFKKEERHFQQIFTMPDDLPVLGIRKIKYPTHPNRYAVIVNTPNRLYQFIGTAFESVEAGGFSNLLSLADISSNYQELPTATDSPVQLWSIPEEGTSLLPKKFAWLTEPGIYSGELDLTNPQTDAVLANAELHPLIVGGGVPLSILTTEFHYLVLYSDRVQAISILTNDLVFEDRFALEDNETLTALIVDEFKETYWAYTNLSVHEIIVNDEDRDVWKIHLARKNFEAALTFARTEVDRDRVITAQAEFYFSEKRYRLAATYFAQSHSLSFEEVALRFITLNDNGALKQFLVKKSETLKSNETTQMTILCMWILELLVHELDKSETTLAAANTFLYTNQVSPPKSGDNDRNSLLEELRQFIVKHKGSIDIEGAFALFSSHGRTQETLFFAEEIGDYERIINHWITRKEWMKALDVLNRQNSDAFFYKFSTVLIEAIPVELINCWIQHSHLDPKPLLPALLKYEVMQAKKPDTFNQAVRYLNHVIHRFGNTDSSIHNYLLSIYVSLGKLDGENELVAFLASQDEDVHYDVQYALRLCMKEGLVRSSIFIYSKLGLFEQAVDLALKNENIELAQINADKPVDDEILRKKLWLKIARYVVDEKKDIKQAIDFLKQCDLLRIEDILPFFPDFVLIDDFKADLCKALEEYNDHIDRLKEDMDEATRSAENIRRDIQNLRNRNVVIHITEQCSVCSLSLLTRQFMVFPCKHVFHSDCLTSVLLDKASSSRKSRLINLLKKMDQSGVKRGNKMSETELAALKEQHDNELSTECPLCNDIMIKSVNAPFDDDLSLSVL
ncbi:Pep3/Vps18/deep orange family-domain-containing protein [Obelidium mucronatum]|nr:Pep3/Vps18/deep orange family-domain-containing protein [Obelidium mucronatum]